MEKLVYLTFPGEDSARDAYGKHLIEEVALEILRARCARAECQRQ